MGWRRSEIEVTNVVDLCDYDDEIMEYVEPDNIVDALELMERWGYRDGDILTHMLEDITDSDLTEALLSRLTVHSALRLAGQLHDMGAEILKRDVKATQTLNDELREKIRQLEEGTTDDIQNV